MKHKPLLLKRIIHLVLSLFMMSLLPASAMAWGDKGHQIIARVAMARLSPEAQQRTAELLGGATIDSVAMWADQMRLSRKSTANWHFYNPDQDCKDGDCLIEAIKKNISILNNTSEQAGNRAEALKFIVHLIGDLHQPLHCADNNDDYGNKVKVVFGGQHTNLHAVWDSYLIDHTKLGVNNYAEQLSNSQDAQSDYLYTRGTITDWALESHSLAARAYDFDKTGNLDDDYYRKSRPIVDTQLLKAGIRLAKILNDIFQEAKS